MLQLYYTVGSPPSRAVLQAIRVLGLQVEVKKVNLLASEHLTPEFLKLNPMHQVPVLVDGDLILTESRAIMTYLVNAHKPGSSYYPTDPKKRFLVDKMLYFDCASIFEWGASIVVSWKSLWLSHHRILKSFQSSKASNLLRNRQERPRRKVHEVESEHQGAG